MIFIQYYPIITIIIHVSKMQVKKTHFHFCHKKPCTFAFFLVVRLISAIKKLLRFARVFY